MMATEAMFSSRITPSIRGRFLAEDIAWASSCSPLEEQNEPPSPTPSSKNQSVGPLLATIRRWSAPARRWARRRRRRCPPADPVSVRRRRTAYTPRPDPASAPAAMIAIRMPVWDRSRAAPPAATGDLPPPGSSAQAPIRANRMNVMAATASRNRRLRAMRTRSSERKTESPPLTAATPVAASAATVRTPRAVVATPATWAEASSTIGSRPDSAAVTSSGDASTPARDSSSAMTLPTGASAAATSTVAALPVSATAPSTIASTSTSTAAATSGVAATRCRVAAASTSGSPPAASASHTSMRSATNSVATAARTPAARASSSPLTAWPHTPTRSVVTDSPKT